MGPMFISRRVNYNSRGQFSEPERRGGVLTRRRILMKSSKLLLVLIAIAAIGSLFSWRVYSAEPKPQPVVWEYKLFWSTGDNANKLAELGKEGWELTSVRTEEQVEGNFHNTRVIYYLKRAQTERK